MVCVDGEVIADIFIYLVTYLVSMAHATLEKVSKDIEDIKGQLRKITYILAEDFELSEEARKELKEARKEPLSDYVDHEKVLKEFA
jgi:hypothetical protein